MTARAFMAADVISSNIGIMKNVSGLFFTSKFPKEFHEKFKQFKYIKSTKEKSERKFYKW